MRVAIHQPHYFPWLGYFAKMAVSDRFILLDEVQFEKGSKMIRNQVQDMDGENRFITISADTKGYLDKKYMEIKTKDPVQWKKRQIDALSNYYRGAPYRDEVIAWIDTYFKNHYDYVCEWTCESIILMKKVLGIETEILYQSRVDYNREKKRSALVLELCKAVSAKTYVSGMGGSVKYLEREMFEMENIEINFFDYQHPIYRQCHDKEFRQGLSCLDILFNCGLEETRRLFVESIRK